MDKTSKMLLAIGLACFGMCLILIIFFGLGDGSSERTKSVATGNFIQMSDQIDKAVEQGDYAFAFKVLNTIPTYFNKYSQLYYNPNTGEIEDYSTNDNKTFNHEQYVRKAISVLKSESDILLNSNNIEAENLYLEHLADFELGVNKVNLGDFWELSDESKANTCYQEAVTIYNDYLISVIRKALVKSNMNLAEKISLLLRDGLSFEKSQSSSSHYIWHYDTEAKDEAQELLNSYATE